MEVETEETLIIQIHQLEQLHVLILEEAVEERTLD